MQRKLCVAPDVLLQGMGLHVTAGPHPKGPPNAYCHGALGHIKNAFIVLIGVRCSMLAVLFGRPAGMGLRGRGEEGRGGRGEGVHVHHQEVRHQLQQGQGGSVGGHARVRGSTQLL